MPPQFTISSTHSLSNKHKLCILDADPDSTTTTPPNSDLLTSPCQTSFGDDDNSCDLLLEEDHFRDSSESMTGDDLLSSDKTDSKGRKKSSKSCGSDTKSGRQPLSYGAHLDLGNSFQFQP